MSTSGTIGIFIWNIQLDVTKYFFVKFYFLVKEPSVPEVDSFSNWSIWWRDITFHLLQFLLKKKTKSLFHWPFCVHAQTLLFNPVKPFSSRGQGFNFQDIDLMIDCWVSCFRIKPHNNEALKVCLLLSSPPASILSSLVHCWSKSHDFIFRCQSWQCRKISSKKWDFYFS